MWMLQPIPVRSRAQVCGRVLVGIAGSNPAGGMEICPFVCCVGSGLCDGLIIVRRSPTGCVCVCVYV